MTKAKNTKKEKDTAPKVTDSDKLKLWVRAGGRCEFPGCNDYLLEDELTGYEFPFAELAHNVGKKKNPKSPRGMNELPIEERSLPENLLLLCPTCHNLIDDKEIRKE